MIKLSKELSLPIEAVGETFGIIAARGAGKSNTAAVMAEGMFAESLPFVVIDPVGSWWGLRSNKAGTGPGLPIPIFGGKRGDVPLEKHGGTLVADLVVDRRLTCILDLTAFESEASKKHFLLEFARRLYQKNEEPLHLFLEEADDYIPQRPMRDEAQLLRAWENIVRRGRARGLGMTMITQRSSVINKNVLTQVQTLIAMRTTGPQDRAAIEEWVKYHDQSRDILSSLSSLRDGEAWVWSPQFLGKTVRVQFDRRHTFDSGATPKMRKGKRPVATLADVDLGKIRNQMADTIEKAKTEDPVELRKKIRELERMVATADQNRPVVKVSKDEVQDAVLAATCPLVKRLDAQDLVFVEVTEVSNRLMEIAGARFGELSQLIQKLQSVCVEQQNVERVVAKTREKRAVVRKPETVSNEKSTVNHRERTSIDGIGKGPNKILESIARFGALGVSRPLIANVAGLSGFTASGGTFRTYVSKLRAAGLVETDRRLIWAIDLGSVVSDVAALTLAEYQEEWYKIVPGESPRRMLRTLVEAWPRSMSKEDLGQSTGFEASGGSFRTYLSKLRALGLVTTNGNNVCASELMFPEVLIS